MIEYLEEDWVDVTSHTTAETEESGQKKDNLVKVTPVLQRKQLLSGILNTVYVLFKIETGARVKGENRPSLNIGVVLDQSGSMEGVKSENSKEAIKKIIRSLDPRQDKLHLVSYANDSIVVFENGDLKENLVLEIAIDQIEAKGSTNLEAGLLDGFQVVKNNIQQCKNNRLFVFSDGQVNEGVTNTAQLMELVNSFQKEGVNTTSFGIGSDFNEELMKGLAESGRGLYFFIDSGESVVPLVRKAFDGIFTVIGTNAVFKVRGKNGAIVKRIVGNHDLLKGASLSDLMEDDLITVLVEVDVPSAASSQDFLTYELKYKPADFQNDDPNASNFVSFGDTISIGVTDDEALAQENNKEVLAALAMAEVSEKGIAVNNFLKNDDVEEAIKVEQYIIQRLKEAEQGDEGGMVKLALGRAEQLLSDMESKRDVGELSKDCDYYQYQCSVVHRKCF